jgi:hypothetical protein
VLGREPTDEELEQELNRLLRVLERCANESPAARRKRRRADPFYKKLAILRKMQKESEAERRLNPPGSDEPKR